MESDKYPNAFFSGKISEKIDVAKNGTFPINATGVLEVHGVKQNRTFPGTITVNNGAVSMKPEFTVMCKDHKLEIPKLVFEKIAETIRVQIAANYIVYKK